MFKAIFSKLISVANDDHYQQVATELSNGKVIKHTHYKAISLFNGTKASIESCYIKLRAEEIAINPKPDSETTAYLKLASELENNHKVQATWMRAIAESNGQEQLILPNYCKIRFRSIVQEQQASHTRAQQQKAQLARANEIEAFKRNPSYYDPSYKKRPCYSCGSKIPKGKLVCGACNTLND